MIKTLVKFSQLHKPVRGLIRKFKIGDFLSRAEVDAIPRSEYAYALYQAAMQAKLLDIKAISAIEFGVAGGKSLLLLEEYAAQIEKLIGVQIKVYGFDTGEGMPTATDYRDLPYIWEKGFFKMDFQELASRLEKAELVIGNVADTIDGFVDQHNPPPIGFISIDTDYYSSAKDCLRIFSNSYDLFLPRVFCYLDDTIGDDWELHNEFVGELLAIKEFNNDHEDIKIAPINGLRHKRIIYSAWNDQMYVAHLFRHPLYDKKCNPKDNWQLSI